MSVSPSFKSEPYSIIARPFFLFPFGRNLASLASRKYKASLLPQRESEEKHRVVSYCWRFHVSGLPLDITPCVSVRVSLREVLARRLGDGLLVLVVVVIVVVVTVVVAKERG
jgi:hypothetical protein